MSYSYHRTRCTDLKFGDVVYGLNPNANPNGPHPLMEVIGITERRIKFKALNDDVSLCYVSDNNNGETYSFIIGHNLYFYLIQKSIEPIKSIKKVTL